MRFLAIKDYWKHQHYHKRGAPWIKLYAGILTDAPFVQLPEAAQAQLMKLWVLASQFGHPLPNNPKLLAGKIGTTGKFYLARMIDAGFVVPCETDDEVLLVSGRKNASKSLDDSSPESSDHAPASVRSRESREIEEEERTTNSSLHADEESAQRQQQQYNCDAAVAELTSLLAGVPNAETALTGFMEGLPSAAKRLVWARSLIASMNPLTGGPRVTPSALVAAMADFNLAERARFPYTGAVFRAFADKAMRDETTAQSPAPRNATNRISDDTMSELERWKRETDAKEAAHA